MNNLSISINTPEELSAFRAHFRTFLEKEFSLTPRKKTFEQKMACFLNQPDWQTAKGTVSQQRITPHTSPCHLASGLYVSEWAEGGCHSRCVVNLNTGTIEECDLSSDGEGYEHLQREYVQITLYNNLEEFPCESGDLTTEGKQQLLALLGKPPQMGESTKKQGTRIYYSDSEEFLQGLITAFQESSTSLTPDEMVQESNTSGYEWMLIVEDRDSVDTDRYFYNGTSFDYKT